MPRVIFQSCGTALFLRVVYSDVNFMRLLILCRFSCRRIDHPGYTDVADWLFTSAQSTKKVNRTYSN
jgi:hypothetical protein